MALGSTRRKSRAVVELVRWFYESHAKDVQVVGLALAILDAMRAVSRSSVCALFQNAFVEPYGDAARRRDEAFFMTCPVPAATPPAIAGVTGGFSSAWNRMSEAAKEDAWNKLDRLMAMA